MDVRTLEENAKIPDEEKFQSLLFKQISKQLLNMFEISINNDEEQTEIEFQYRDNGTSKSLVLDAEVTEIEKDGNCLFGSIVHQLFGHELKSQSHKTAISTLRKNVVAYIKDNYADFEFDLKGSVYEHFDDLKETIEDIDTECELYLEKLQKNKFWGGSETIRAASRIHKANILTINEGDRCTFTCGFSNTFSRTLIIAYRFSKKGSHRNHYDSVVRMDDSAIFKLSTFLSKTAHIVQEDSHVETVLIE